jgi:hypothetical protein
MTRGGGIGASVESHGRNCRQSNFRCLYVFSLGPSIPYRLGFFAPPVCGDAAVCWTSATGRSPVTVALHQKHFPLPLLIWRLMQSMQLTCPHGEKEVSASRIMQIKHVPSSTCPSSSSATLCRPPLLRWRVLLEAVMFSAIFRSVTSTGGVATFEGVMRNPRHLSHGTLRFSSTQRSSGAVGAVAVVETGGLLREAPPFNMCETASIGHV